VIRKAKPQDIKAIVELAVESVSIDALPVDIDREAMKSEAEICLQPAHFLMVSEIDGVVVGAVAAQVAPSFWFRGLNCSVLLHYSRVPGEWVKLMRELSKWVKGRSRIKVAIIELEPVHQENPKMIRFLKRLGFGRESMNLSYVRGA